MEIVYAEVFCGDMREQDWAFHQEFAAAYHFCNSFVLTPIRDPVYIGYMSFAYCFQHETGFPASTGQGQLEVSGK